MVAFDPSPLDVSEAPISSTSRIVVFLRGDQLLAPVRQSKPLRDADLVAVLESIVRDRRRLQVRGRDDQRSPSQ